MIEDTFTGSQRDAGRIWYLLLKKILEDFGFHMCPLEPLLFIYHKKPETISVVTPPDDFLCECSNNMKHFVLVTT